jgi:hypothetical protein
MGFIDRLQPFDRQIFRVLKTPAREFWRAHCHTTHRPRSQPGTAPLLISSKTPGIFSKTHGTLTILRKQMLTWMIWNRRETRPHRASFLVFCVPFVASDFVLVRFVQFVVQISFMPLSCFPILCPIFCLFASLLCLRVLVSTTGSGVHADRELEKGSMPTGPANHSAAAQMDGSSGDSITFSSSKAGDFNFQYCAARRRACGISPKPPERSVSDCVLNERSIA